MGMFSNSIMKTFFLVLALMSAYCLAAPQIQHWNPHEGRSDAKLAHFEYMLKNDNAFNCKYDVYRLVSYATQDVHGELVRVQYTIRSPYGSIPQMGCSERMCAADISLPSKILMNINCDQIIG